MKLLLFLLCFALSPSAFALINGTSLIGEPDVVRLVFNNGWMCTGTFIDPYTILTAAHCITPENEPLHLDQVLSENDEVVRVDQLALLPTPAYSHQWWPSYDIGIIKTSENPHFKGAFRLRKVDDKIFGSSVLIGAGKVDLTSNVRKRTSGKNSYLKLGSVLFFLGKSRTSNDPGINASVAPNDSGGPVVDQESNEIVGVMTTTTVKDSARYHLPALGTATSTVTKVNLEFILLHMGKL